MARLASLFAALTGALAASGPAHAAETKSLQTGSAHEFAFDLPNGEALSLKEFEGKVVLVVNTATECGFSGQISGLQELHERYQDRGLVVLGVPSNDFGGQEPRANDEIAGYCEAKYGAQFLMTSKTSVRGEAAHPFYQWAAAELGATARPYWNFHKYIIAGDGSLTGWFATPTTPTSRKLTSAIERELDRLPPRPAS